MAKELFEFRQEGGYRNGSISLTYVGAPLSDETFRKVRVELENFVEQCHTAFVCYLGAVSSMDAMRQRFERMQDENSLVGLQISSTDTRDVVRPMILSGDATEIFSDGGKFESLQAWSFVANVFTEWESVTRRRVSGLLGVDLQRVESDLMGDWGRLRNWLLHKDGRAEIQYFGKAPNMVTRLNSSRGQPEVTAAGVSDLMSMLRHLVVVVR